MPHRILLATISLLLICSSFQGQERASFQLKKVVIDPGHGGKDPGTISPDGKVFEKNITLSVSLKLGQLIKDNYPNIEVIYTRKTDIFIPLNERSRIANKHKADLFISIHVNGVESRTPSGSETFVMGIDKTNSNFEVTMLENSVIMLEGDDYSTKYEGFNPNDPESYIVFSLLQNAHLEQSLIMASLVQKHFENGPIKVNRGIKQAPFLVLWKTSMPGILVELGFITNQNDLRVLNDKKNHDKFAESIFNAFKEFKTQYEKGNDTGNYLPVPRKETDTSQQAQNEVKTSVTTAQQAQTTTQQTQTTAQQAKPAAKTDTSEHFRLQILAVGKVLPAGSSDFKGRRDINYIKAGNLYKYTIGKYSTIDDAKEAQSEIRKHFPQAFIIKVRNNTIVPLNN
jgi:N-acetylmuramoyl-L-alanine amidase